MLLPQDVCSHFLDNRKKNFIFIYSFILLFFHFFEILSEPFCFQPFCNVKGREILIGLLYSDGHN